MKINILFIISCFICYVSSAQSDSSRWEAKLIVRHPLGFYDTLIVGADVNGAIGIQAGMDIMDTNFNYPVAIRGHDSIVYQQYNTCPANMKKDIRAFDSKIVYSFYIKADTFPQFFVQPFPPDSMVAILYDTSEFNYSNKDWVLTKVIFYSLGGYMEAMDGNMVWLKGNNQFNPQYDEDLVLLYEQNPPEYLWGNCNNGDKVIRFDLVIGFQKSVGVDKINHTEYIVNNQYHNYLEIKFNETENLSFSIIDLNGRIVQKGTSPPSNLHRINYNLDQGLYILSIQNDKINISYKFLSI